MVGSVLTRVASKMIETTWPLRWLAVTSVPAATPGFAAPPGMAAGGEKPMSAPLNALPSASGSTITQPSASGLMTCGGGGAGGPGGGGGCGTPELMIVWNVGLRPVPSLSHRTWRLPTILSHTSPAVIGVADPPVSYGRMSGDTRPTRARRVWRPGRPCLMVAGMRYRLRLSWLPGTRRIGRVPG